MRFGKSAFILAILLAVVPAKATAQGPPAGTRYVVFEAFLRQSSAQSLATGPLIDQLARDYAASPVVFLEHDFDHPAVDRLSRYWAACGCQAAAPPLAIADSGHGHAGGYTAAQYMTYKTMVDRELARAPGATIASTARRVSNHVTVTGSLTNLTGTPMSAANAATLHLLVYEIGQVRITGRFVRAVASQPLTVSGTGTVTFALDSPEIFGVTWSNVRALVFADYRPPGAGGFDMLQAATPTIGIGDAPRWQIVGAGDLDGNGRADLVMESSDGHLAAWFMNGFTQVSSALLSTAPVAVEGWHVRAIGDLNGDGRADLVWENGWTGTVAAWLMNGSSQIGNALLHPSPVAIDGWHVAAAGDLDGDDRADIVWQHDAGYVLAWFMDGLARRSGSLLHPEPVAAGGWRIAGVGDMSRDGTSDILWESAAGHLAVWLMNGTTQVSSLLLYDYPVAVDGWRPAGVGDLNADGSTDLVWQHADGSFAAWLMNATTQVVNGFLSPANRPLSVGRAP